MRPIVTDGVAWSVTIVSPAKTAEPIVMQFGLRTRVSPRNRAIDEVSDPSREGTILRGGKVPPIVKYTDTLVSWAKMAEPIGMLFGFWARVGPRNPVLDGVHPYGKGVILRGKGRPIIKYRDALPLLCRCAKQAEPIEIPFGLRTGVGPRTRCWFRNPSGKGQF